MMLIRLYFLVLFLTSSYEVSFDALHSIFEIDSCIELSQISLNDAIIKPANYDPARKIDHLQSTDYLAKTKDVGRNALSVINELAQLNEISYYYFLESEEGPHHNRIFKIRLQLNDEEYYGEASSIKTAKNAAAENGLKNTKYKVPLIKSKMSDKSIAFTHTVQLNNMATKLGIKVSYVLLNEAPSQDEDLPDYSYNKVYLPDIKPYKSYVTKLNHSIYHPHKNKYIEVSNTNNPNQPFVVAVLVADKEYIGTGFTVQSARHDAAAKALKALKQISNVQREQCLAEGVTCNPNNVKSPISLVYEIGSKRGASVHFEIISQTGPAHEKEFVTKCQVGDLVTEGVGKSKKISKKNSAEKMFKLLEMTIPIADTFSISNLKPIDKETKKKKKSKKVIKNKIAKFAKDAQNFAFSVFDHFSNSKVHKDHKYRFDENIQDKPSGNRNENYQNDNFKEQLLHLTQQKSIHIEFIDLNEKESNFLSYLLLGVHPVYVCLGYGDSFSSAHEKASMEALNFLHKTGMDTVILSKEMFENIYENNLQKFNIFDILEEDTQK